MTAFFIAKLIYMGYLWPTPVLQIEGEIFETIRLSNKGQIVIPKRVRSAHGREPGLEFVVEDGKALSVDFHKFLWLIQT